MLVLPVLLAIGVLLVAWLVARAFNKGHVVVVGAGGSGQDAHKVTIVAQVFQQAGHPTRGSERRTYVFKRLRSLIYRKQLLLINFQTTKFFYFIIWILNIYFLVINVV